MCIVQNSDKVWMFYFYDHVNIISGILYHVFHKRYLTPNGIEECRPDSDSVNVNKIIEIAKDVCTNLF